MAQVSWEVFDRQVAACTMCPLHEGIHHKVPGQGDKQTPLMFIGEGPGQVEDEEGLAFVGPAGQLLTRMLAAIDIPRDKVYICNIVKCRPPHNRVPLPEEAVAELTRTLEHFCDDRNGDGEVTVGLHTYFVDFCSVQQALFYLHKIG